MSADGLRDKTPHGRRAAYRETRAAWEILAILDRELLPIDQMLERLAGFQVEDLRAAYWLTRRRAELIRRRILVDGEDDGRAARIRARNILARARKQSAVEEEGHQLEEEARSVMAAIRGSPPPSIGIHAKSSIQVLLLAGAPQPLTVRLRRLLSVRPTDLAAAHDRLAKLPADAWLRKGWPSRLERPHMLRVLELAKELQGELTTP
jgi:hypothetical protein